MSTKFTRSRFLRAVSAGATYLALTATVGCDLLAGSSRRGAVRARRKVWTLPDVAAAPSLGVWVFRSRPELSPPAVAVTIQANNTAPGYIFVAPEEGGSGQGGSMILDDSGQLVWFRPLQGTTGRVMNFKVQLYRGSPVLTWGETPGEYVIFDDSYREIARIRAANGYNGDHHEFIITPQDTAMITIYNSVPRDLSSVGGSTEGVAWQGIVQELDIETGEVLFEWRSIEHVGLDETYVSALDDHYSGIDYFHINSIDVDHDDNLIVSARETSTVYKIDRITGEIIWRLGGKKSDFEMGPGTRFAYQHDARRQPDGTITIFDNGTMVFDNGIPHVVEESRGIVLELDEERMTASLVRQYNHPDQQFADAAGNLQALPNGNVFIGWGRALAMSEFAEDGELLFNATLPPNNRFYRAFRFPWSARPSSRPVAAAERVSGEEITVYASWNGATEVATWDVLAGESPENLERVGSAAWNGFETTMVVQTSEPYVALQAKDPSGRLLGSTEPVPV